MASVPRHAFVPVHERPDAYADRPLPIGEGQTISAPHMVAIMADLLELRPDDRVLEIGTGCGYHAGVTAEIVGAENVLSVEYHEKLAEEARERLGDLGYEGVSVRAGDGKEGWSDPRSLRPCVPHLRRTGVPRCGRRTGPPWGLLVAPSGRDARRSCGRESAPTANWTGSATVASGSSGCDESQPGLPTWGTTNRRAPASSSASPRIAPRTIGLKRTYSANDSVSPPKLEVEERRERRRSYPCLPAARRARTPDSRTPGRRPEPRGRRSPLRRGPRRRRVRPGELRERPGREPWNRPECKSHPGREDAARCRDSEGRVGPAIPEREKYEDERYGDGHAPVREPGAEERVRQTLHTSRFTPVTPQRSASRYRSVRHS